MLTDTVRIGKRNALYIPKKFAEALGLEAGEKVQLSLDGRVMRIEVIGDPLRLALEGEKFASISPDGIEAISTKEQSKYARDTP